MNRLVALALAAAMFNTASAYTEWELEDGSYRVDTLYHATIGPGITETHLDVTSGSYVAKIFVAQIDLTNPYVTMRVISAGDTINGLSNIPNLAKSHDTAQCQQIIGTNADFANMGNTSVSSAGYVMCDGEFYGVGNYNYVESFSSYLYFEKNRPYFVRSITENLTMKFPNGKTVATRVNKAQRNENDLILFTPRFGHSTRTNEWGRECQLKIVSQETDYLSGRAVEFEVTSPWVGTQSGEKNGIGNMAIPSDGFVLSSCGDGYRAMESLKVGDRLTLSGYLIGGGVDIYPTQIVGGSPIMLKSGKVDEARVDDADKLLGHLNNLEPRTAVGASKDRKTLYMVVVDGRRPGVSMGIRTKTLARVMQNLGCYNAMNCDGGGSSQFYVRNLVNMDNSACKVRNLPINGTYLRPVSNGLFASSTAPSDDEVASIELRDKNLNLKSGDKYTPVVFGYNKYGVLVNPDVKGFNISVASQAGTVENGSTLNVGNAKINTTLRVEYKGAEYITPLYLNGGGEYVAGITEIVVDDTIDVQPEYYTLQGIKVSNPEPNRVVIVRRGSKVTKEIVR